MLHCARFVFVRIHMEMFSTLLWFSNLCNTNPPNLFVAFFFQENTKGKGVRCQGVSPNVSFNSHDTLKGTLQGWISQRVRTSLILS